MAAPALCLSPQRLTVTWTPAIKMHHAPLSSPPAQSHPPLSVRRHLLRFLDLEPTTTPTASRASRRVSRLICQGVLPHRFMTGTHKVQSVTWKEALLRAILTTHHVLLLSTPPPSC